MCGIVGLWTPRGWSREHSAELVRMRDAIAHRGPDEAGEWTDPAAGIGFGHRRLSIIDLSPAGSQPMRSRDGRWTIAFNGEIYNFRELRTDLMDAGVVFRGASDTEVLLEGIALWGLRPTVARAAGMFAFAVWDSMNRSLHLGRDRLGEKPLYYGWFEDAFIFGSELKALLASGRVNRAGIDRAAVAQLLRYSCIPAPRTIYEGVKKLPPATITTVHEDGRVEINAYWSLADVADRPREASESWSFSESADRVEARLRSTIREQMISDVPLGALLSGGVDSSLVVALMARESSHPVRTFSIGFREPGYDEATFARQVASHIGSDHTELYVSPEEARAVIPQLTGIYDEPFADASQIPTILVSRLARTQVTVALTGDGGDEVFGGYERYFTGDRLWRALSRSPQALRRVASSAIRWLSPRAWDAASPLVQALLPRRRRVQRLGDRAHKVASLLGAGSRAELYEHFRSHWLGEPSLVVGTEENGGWNSSFRSGDVTRLSFVEEMMLTDALSYLPDDVLVKVDRAAMSASLETRAPLLDHRVAELAWSLPLSHKVRGGEGKRVLKEILHRYVPRSLVDRPKMGFGVPLDSWLRGPLREWGEDLLSADRIRRQGLLRPEPIRRAWAEHLSGHRNLQYPLWDVLMLQSWLPS